jgi:hypothetical protein
MSFVPVSITHNPILPSERQSVRAVSVSSFWRVVGQNAATIRACVAVKDGPCRVPYGHTKNYACGCIAAPPHARLRQDYRVGQGAILKGTGLSHLADDG